MAAPRTVSPAPAIAASVVDDEIVRPSDDAPLFRVFLKDGSSLISYGELARLDQRVVFSMLTSASTVVPQLHLVDIAADRIDWVRTTNYADAVRASRYVATRAETDYALLTNEIAGALNDVAATNDPARRLVIVERARKRLADWPPTHFNYKQDDVRQMLEMLDEAIAELRAASGGQRFDLALVAAAPPPPPEPLLAGPTPREAIEQTLTAATLVESPAERTSLLSVAMSALERDRDKLPADWVVSTHESARLTLTRELELNAAYSGLSTRALKVAAERARMADVRGVQRVLADIKSSDSALGLQRPDVVNALVAAVEDQLDGARRLRLERDRWALRAPEFRRYRAAISSPLDNLARLTTPLEDIKALAGSSPDALGSIQRTASRILKTASEIIPPDELRDAHAVLVSAAQLADTAARVRREAALTGEMTRAWDASSAAAGALMLAARARSEIRSTLRLPQLPR
jgi:hypothetical protein